MEESKLNDDVYEQIKDFDHKYLTEEQELLVDRLILNEELIDNYKKYGLCDKCKQPRNGYWCQCNAMRFRQNFDNWTSGNHHVDQFIQNIQLKAKDRRQVIEWYEYDRFEDIEYLAKGGFGTTYKAIWKDGPILYWDRKDNQWVRNKTYRNHSNFPVALKCLHNSQDIMTEFLAEVRHPQYFCISLYKLVSIVHNYFF